MQGFIASAKAANSSQRSITKQRRARSADCGEEDPLSRRQMRAEDGPFNAERPNAFDSPPATALHYRMRGHYSTQIWEGAVEEAVDDDDDDDDDAGAGLPMNAVGSIIYGPDDVRACAPGRPDARGGEFAIGITTEPESTVGTTAEKSAGEALVDDGGARAPSEPLLELVGDCDGGCVADDERDSELCSPAPAPSNPCPWPYCSLFHAAE